MTKKFDVIIIGAGPAGTLAANILAAQGLHCAVVEKSRFPRFVVGESLLPQAMVFLEKAGVLEALEEQSYQIKTGAVFVDNENVQSISFTDMSHKGPTKTWQVSRESFDDILAKQAMGQGAKIFFETTVLGADFSQFGAPKVSIQNDKGEKEELEGRFVLDASGQGRVLAKALNLEVDSQFLERQVLFSRVEGLNPVKNYEGDKLLLSLHPQDENLWYWIIPFANGQASVGVTGLFANRPEVTNDNEASLKAFLKQASFIDALTHGQSFVRPIAKLSGYAHSVKSLYGQDYALMGNAAGFSDPIFSSGVTLALYTGFQAANLLLEQFKGAHVDWEKDYARPIKAGTAVFEEFIKSWYQGGLRKIIFNYDRFDSPLRHHIVSILAGYVWDEDNPVLKNPGAYLRVVEKLCD